MIRPMMNVLTWGYRSADVVFAVDFAAGCLGA